MNQTRGTETSSGLQRRRILHNAGLGAGLAGLTAGGMLPLLAACRT